ncbi:hypothetical protein ADEAN_000399900 [Angomonas deanei]|uniref:Uncharacterized protein n=1 Tax=Angomonas deanei TaxID=59799 RepID=A0A7G2CC64_9TRYP|nr:hypothetical protein ADEAN_000399900 [Angomonas deanei]
MGCGATKDVTEPDVVAPLKGGKRGASAGSKKQEGSSTSDVCPRNLWEAGYLLPDSPGGPVSTYDDYRGFQVTTTNSMSRNKTDNLCSWADTALEGKKKNKGVFFNPQNPAAWPRDLLTAYDPSSHFANHKTI